MRHFPEQFAATVARHGERLAVSVRGPSGVRRWTYAQLNAMSVHAAARLAAAGVGRGNRVALLGENGAEWCAAYLGVLRLGAIAVPFDTNYSAAQVATLLRDSGAARLLVSSRFEATAREAARSEMPVDLLGGLVGEGAGAAEGTAPPTPKDLGPADAAVILYTSGTTADPKGVVLSHGNLLAEGEGAFSIVHVDEHDVVLGVLPLFHSLAQMANLLLPFSLGAHVVYLETLATQELLAALKEEGVTIFACVPQFFYLIHGRVLEQVKKGGALTRLGFTVLTRLNRALRGVGLNAGPLFFGQVHRTIGRSMRLLITGGSKFDPAVGVDLSDIGLTILQAYGLTETSGAATVTRMGDPIATVGRPLKGVEVRVAPPAQGPDDGEVLIRGGVVMQGYWQRPDATAEVLKDGWLYTGDLGRLDAEGRLTITGRSKEIIVLGNGKNIYPEEVEAYYRASEVIKELCVLGVEGAGAHGAERLHAVVVPDLDVIHQRKVVNVQDLLRFELEGVSINIPPHKRVLTFDVSMDPLPRTTTGKLKRPAIRQLAAELARRREQPASQTSGAEADLPPHVRRVLHAVRAVVTRVPVHADANFELDLGLDSMERVELLAALEHRFGMRVPEELAQTAFTVRDLAAAFEQATGGEAASTDWATLLTEGNPAEALAPILRPRPITAPLYFAVARAVTRLGGRPRVVGLEHLPREGACIVSPNHQSFIDPFLVGPSLPYPLFRRIFAVGAAEYFQTPLMQWVAAQLNVVPVDPDAHLLPAMQAAAEGLRHDRVLMLFPEGERSADGRVKHFKKGSAVLALHLGVPIVPVAITGAWEVWPRNKPLSWSRLVWRGPRPTVVFGAPLRAQPGEDEAALTARLRAEVERLWLAATPAEQPPVPRPPA